MTVLSSATFSTQDEKKKIPPPASSFSAPSSSSSSPSNNPYPTARTVAFPYPSPYPQQLALMDALLEGLRDGDGDSSSPNNNDNDEKKKKKRKGRLLLLESPTGTGKSLSLACAATAWQRWRETEDTRENDDDDDDANDDWCRPSRAEREDASRSRARGARARLEARLARARISSASRRAHATRAAVADARERERAGRRRRRRRAGATAARGTREKEEENFCVDDYRSDGEGDENEESDDEDSEDDDDEAAALLRGPALDGSGVVLPRRGAPRSSSRRDDDAVAVGDVTPGAGVRKIVYAARTHSQLSQFVGELRRTERGNRLRVVALASRRVLCGNGDVNKSDRSEAAVTEACLDSQKKKQTKDDTTAGAKRPRVAAPPRSCPLLSSPAAVSALALQSLSEPTDVEDLGRLGRDSGACAYYAARAALPAAEVVVAPYVALLGRDRVGLDLRGALVVFDEAHNLPETLRQSRGSGVGLAECERAYAALRSYADKYSSRLNGRNLFHLGQLRRCLKSLVEYLTKVKRECELVKRTTTETESTMTTANELLFELRLDNVNLFRLDRYLERTRLPQKLLGFVQSIFDPNNTNDKHNNIVNSESFVSKHVSPLAGVREFLSRLNSSGKEGKVVVERSATSEPRLRYVLLDPASTFASIVDEARAVVLVGGTLRPFGHLAAELCGPDAADTVREAVATDVDVDRNDDAERPASHLVRHARALTTFCCGHVVPPSHVSVVRLARGPTGRVLDFRRDARADGVDELGRALVNLTRVVGRPGGVVVFFGSRDHEADCARRWRTTGVWAALQRGGRRARREPRDARDVGRALEDHVAAANTVGALLTCVTGGRVSEGINFSDDAARCVVVVGLPYPNATDPVLREKMRSLDAAGTVSGRSYYRALCARAVNQSVGRAVRHANDYACVVLADVRWTTDARAWRSLPGWLRSSERVWPSADDVVREGNASFGSMLRTQREFFAERRGDAREESTPKR